MAVQSSRRPDVDQLVSKLKVGRAAPHPQLNPPHDAKSFTICHRARDGPIDFRYAPDDDEATCVINAVHICRSMLENQNVRAAFIKIAKEYSQEFKNAWFLQEASDEHKGDVSRVFDDFHEKIREDFPIIFVDDTYMETLRVANHFRQPWTGTFQPSKQYITVNGGIIDEMVQGAKKQKSKRRKMLIWKTTILGYLMKQKIQKRPQKDPDRESYNNRLFQIANSLLHETAHVFVTYLSRGEQNTPTKVKARTHWQGSIHFQRDPNLGEAGHKLEAMVFGGTLEYWAERDTKPEADNASVAYLIDKEGHRFRVLPETIERTVKCDFKFPYDREQNYVTGMLKPKAFNDPVESVFDPMIHRMWEKIWSGEQPPPTPPYP